MGVVKLLVVNHCSDVTMKDSLLIPDILICMAYLGDNVKEWKNKSKYLHIEKMFWTLFMF